MAKIYTNKAVVIKKLKPKEETISFLLNYSKALNVIEIEGKVFEIIKN